MTSPTNQNPPGAGGPSKPGRDPRKPDYGIVVDLVREMGPSTIAALRVRLPTWTSGQISRALAQAVRDNALVRKGRGSKAKFQLAQEPTQDAAPPPQTPISPPPAAVLQQVWQGGKPASGYLPGEGKAKPGVKKPKPGKRRS